jgi:hypothetical protein
MVSFRGHRRLVATTIAACLFSLASAAADAQSSISFSGGASIDPEQVYAGVAWESPDIGGRFRLRPGIDGGFGDGLRLANINIDLMVKFPLGTSAWSLIQGGGPTITVSKFSGDFEDAGAELHAGGSYLLGFQHTNGFFAEFRVGGGSFVPQLKLGVGWAVEFK